MKGTVICDGRGDATKSTGGVGVVLTVHSEGSWNTISFEEEFKKKIDNTTNIVAEHLAMQYGMEVAEIAGVTELKIYNDSQTPVYQLQGKYRVKQPHLKPIVDKSWEMASKFDSIEVIWTPRENTKRADALATASDRPRAARRRPGGPVSQPPVRRNPFAT